MHRILLLSAILTAVTQSATAQWVTFQDDTATRLSLSSVGINDGQEKDIAIADFNHDFWTDVVVVRKQPFSAPGARQDVLLMNETGVLVDRTAELAPGFLADLTDARDVLCTDLNMDGWDDIVVATTFGDAPKFYRNLGVDGQGTWLGFVDESSRIGPIGNQSMPFRMCAISAGDVSGDAVPDLMFSNYNGGDDLVMINDGTGVFTDETVARLGPLANFAFGTQNTIVDMDNDGDNDIVKSSSLFNAPPFGIGTFILWNDGTGHYSQFVQVPGTTQDYMFVVGMLDANNTRDLYVVLDPQDTIQLATVNGPQSLTWNGFEPSPSPRTAGFGGNAKLADIDHDGDLDLGVGPIDVDIANCGSPVEFASRQHPGDGALFDPWPGSQSQNFHVDPHDFAFLDINNDGCLDIFMGLCAGWRVFIQTNGNCFLLGDMNCDGVLNGRDIGPFVIGLIDRAGFIAMYPNCDLRHADFNNDLSLDSVDLNAFVARLLIG